MSKRTGKRLGLGIALLTVLSLGLAACSGNGGGSSTGSGKGDTITIQFWNGLTGTDKPAVDKVIKDFNASQDRIVVVNDAMPWDALKQKLLSSIAANDGPDVVSTDVNEIVQYVDAGALQPLDDFYGSGTLDDENLVAAAVDATKVDDKAYGIPLSFYTSMVYWNKDLFTKAGYDHAPATWDELAEMAKKLTVDGNKDGKAEQYGIAMSDHDGLWTFQPLLWNAGGGVFTKDGTAVTLDDPKTLEGLNFWVDLIRDDKVSPIGLTGADADALFQSGKAAMLIEGPWVAPAFTDAGIDFEVARTPKGPDGQFSLAGSIAFSVPSNIDKETKDAVYEFTAFWNSHDTQATYASTTGFPSTRSDLTEADFGDNPLPAVFGDPDVTANARMYTAGIRNGTKVDTEVFVPTLQKALNGKGTVDSLFPAAQKEAEQLFTSK